MAITISDITVIDDSRNVTAAQVNITATGDLRLQDTTGGEYVALQAPGTLSSSYTLTLPAADGTSGQSIVTDGSGTLSFVTVGGLPELYAENPSSPTAPSATGTNAVAIGSNTEATGDRSMALIEGANATNLRAFAVGFNTTASGANSIAMGPSAVASGNQSIAIGSLADATSNYSLALGYTAQAVTGLYATAISRSYASGTDSFAAAIADNSSSYGATGANSVAIGYLAKATNSDSVAVGDTANASGVGAISILKNSSASGTYSIALGYGSSATTGFAVALGTEAKASIERKFAFSGGRFSSDGDAQYGLFVLRSDTTDATPESLNTTNGAVSTANNQIILPNNSAYFFSGTIVARQDAASGTAMGAWEIKGAIRREGSAGTTTLVKSTIDEFSAPAGWSIALTADTTNGGLAITVTGAAATNIRWVATVHTSEVTY